MQRRESLGEVTKIPRLSTGSTQRFKSRRSQSSISSIKDVFACEAASEGHGDLSASGMKLGSQKNRDDDEERNAEAGAADVPPTDPDPTTTIARTRKSMARNLSGKKPSKLKKPRNRGKKQESVV